MGRTACTEPQCLYKGALYFFFTPILFLLLYALTTLLSDIYQHTMLEASEHNHLFATTKLP